MITWHINDNCNFRCDYCHTWLSSKTQEPIKVSRLSEGLRTLGNDWVFLISGGEPFLEPNFIEICQELTKKHFLALNTNLSLNNIYDFADQVDPERTIFINAAVHIIEREKTDKNLEAYIEKAHYPASFTEEEGEFIRAFDADWPEFALLDEIPSLKGKLCHAGGRFLFRTRNGDLRRCSGIFNKYGNLFENKVIFDVSPKPYPSSNCAALYEGKSNNQKRPAIAIQAN